MALQMGIERCNLIRSSLTPFCPCLQAPPLSHRLVLSLNPSKFRVVFKGSNNALRVSKGGFQKHWTIMAMTRAEQDWIDQGETNEVGVCLQELTSMCLLSAFYISNMKYMKLCQEEYPSFTRKYQWV